MLIQGSCHCGNVSFALDWSPDPTEIPARPCSCTFCLKHGGVWTSCPSGSLTVNVREPDSVSRYGFGTHTADFHVCTVCGVVPVVTSRIDGRLYAVVSVNAFENPGVPLRRLEHARFDGEDEATRLARRARNWIGEVTFSDPGV